MLTIENPFSAEEENNYHLITFGDKKEDIVFNQPKERQAFKFKFHQMVDFCDVSDTNPKIQLIRKSRNDAETGVNFVSFVNDHEDKHHIIVISLN